MSHTEIRFARIYLHESQHLLKEIMMVLHDEEQLGGVTVFRGVSGFGSSGKIHDASLVDLSFDLPLVIEFYDTTTNVESVIARLQADFELKHIISWPAVSHTR